MVNQKMMYEIAFEEKRGDVVQELRLPCGECVGCKMERARQWAVRCLHESFMHERNCFITLTYNDKHLPMYGELDYREFQNFMKRLRKKYCYHLPTKKHQGPIRNIRFFMCGEYGELGNRPHYHACLFGFDFDDKVHFKKSQSGEDIYTSKELDALWMDGGDSLGFCTVGDVTYNSASYVARYIMKKEQGTVTKKYDKVDVETGEVSMMNKEFVHMSLRPGIGARFYEKYFSDIFPHDHCIVNGKQQKPPRYYYKKLKEKDEMMYEDLAWERAKRSLQSKADNTEERLLVKEHVLKAKLQFLKREL